MQRREFLAAAAGAVAAGPLAATPKVETVASLVGDLEAMGCEVTFGETDFLAGRPLNLIEVRHHGKRLISRWVYGKASLDSGWTVEKGLSTMKQDLEIVLSTPGEVERLHRLAKDPRTHCRGVTADSP